ncbi:YggT family protein [Candidatus Poribacteria bacterium]|nr:YggT family protein [Candidatus Poribacteria bacterium]
MDMLARFISELLEIFTIVVLANVILSWFVFGTQNSVVRQLYWWTSRVVDPVLSPIRNALGPMTRNLGIDISPFVLIIFLQFLRRMLW